MKEYLHSHGYEVDVELSRIELEILTGNIRRLVRESRTTVKNGSYNKSLWSQMKIGLHRLFC
ncbi:MAG: hypothetical protein V8S37_03070, partial [Lachnospiraceae bacterium]